MISLILTGTKKVYEALISKATTDSNVVKKESADEYVEILQPVLASDVNSSHTDIDEIYPKIIESIPQTKNLVDAKKELNVHEIDNDTELPTKQQLEIQTGETKPGLIENNILMTLKPEFNEVQIKEQTSEKIIVCKVVKKTCKKVFVSSSDQPIDLNKVIANFVPIVGDWVNLDCLNEINEDASDLGSCISKVKAIKPNATSSVMGKVTMYDEASRHGIVNGAIVFTKDVCLTGYLPSIGDKVFVKSIKSDQNLHGQELKMRALELVPWQDFQGHPVARQFKCGLGKDEMTKLMEDKENIEIIMDTSITLDYEEIKCIEIKIKNSGNFSKKVLNCFIRRKKDNSLLELITPAKNTVTVLKPEGEIVYSFECKGKLVGKYSEFVKFKFAKAGALFEIGRNIEITVNDPNVKNLCQKRNMNNCSCRSGENSQSIIPQEYEDGMYIRGVKPFKVGKFKRKGYVPCKVPTLLWSISDSIMQYTLNEKLSILEEKIPYLQVPLSFHNYKIRFDYLLYLEEIEKIIRMKRFNRNDVVMKKFEEYLILNVPGLAEKRPLLMVGDRVEVCVNEALKHYEGYVHKVKNLDVYLKFHPTFHESYDSEKCHVSFKVSNVILQRCHQAIHSVVECLGSGILFPTLVQEKKPQYDFIEEQEDFETIAQTKLSQLRDQKDKMNLIDLILKKKLRWINQKLNSYQKEAVKNILKGVARPLPYVIFGPPGTGKSVTMVEAILQIYFTMSESRILIATPSNNSANVIAERLLDTNKLRPGDLVRLVGHSYMEKVPEKLAPFSEVVYTFVENNDLNVKSDSKAWIRRLCHHRIIVATCMTSGIFHLIDIKSGHFSHIFVDEAGQAIEPEIMIPLSLGHKDTTQVVLAGDPKQLGPISFSQTAGCYGLSDSFLVRLLYSVPYQKDPASFESGYDPRLITKLLINYRSLPELLELPNKLFYDSELISQIDPEHSEEARLLQQLSNELPQRLGNPSPIIFHCLYGENRQDPYSPSWFNPDEAVQIFIYLLMLYNNGLGPNDIGIITPYFKQVHFIKKFLTDQNIQDLPKIGSVEEFQGQERKVILLSTVRTTVDEVAVDKKQSIGFVAERERLNVAITRAKALLIIIGDPQLLQCDVHWRSVINYCRARCSVIDHKL